MDASYLVQHVSKIVSGGHMHITEMIAASVDRPWDATANEKLCSSIKICCQ